MKTLTRKHAGIFALSVLCTAGVSAAGPSPTDFAAKARVTSIEPLVRFVEVTTPREVCWNEAVQQPARTHQSKTPVVAGGILGGVVGNQFGGGRGRDILTIAGALLGASIGNDVANQNRRTTPATVAYERVCETESVTHQEERIDGYRVTYKYAGREFMTIMPQDPGEYVRVRVYVEPIAYNDASASGPQSRGPFGRRGPYTS